MVGWRYQRNPRDLSPKPKTEPTPPRDIPWTNAVRTIGACTHDVIYSRCDCDRPTT